VKQQALDPEGMRGKGIVLFRTDRLGDLVLALPVVEALKAALPHTRIDVVTAPATAGLAWLQPNVSRVLPLPGHGPAGLIRLARILSVAGYEMALHLYPRPAQVLATFLARIPQRAGTAYRAYSPLLNRRIRLHRRTMVTHERELNLGLVASLGIPCGTPGAGLRVPQRACERVQRFLDGRGPGLARGRFVVLHPGSGGSSMAWPPEHFAELARGLSASGWPVLLTGTEADRPVTDRVHGEADARPVNLCGRLDLPHLAALLSLAPLTVSNSTGPLHLADALGGAVIGLYSRHAFASPRRWGPWRQPANVFIPAGPPCRQCTRERCSEGNCMASIEPVHVLERAARLLESSRAPAGPDAACEG